LITSIFTFFCLSIYSISNKEWKFTAVGWLDPHIFLNYFIPDLNGTFDTYYKVSRIPWIFFGRTLYVTLGYDRFIYFLPYIILLFYSFIFLFFSKYFDIRTYTIGLTFLILTPFFHGSYSGGWTYQNPLLNMLILAAYVLTFSIFKTGAGMEKRIYLKIIVLSVIFTNIFVLNFLDSIMIIPSLLIILYKLVKDKLLLSGVFVSILGTVISIIVLSIFSHFLGYNFEFWKPMVEFYFWLNGPDQNHLLWYRPLSSGWWRSAYYLIIPLSFSFVCSVQILRLFRTWLKDRSLRFLSIYDFYVVNHLFLTIFLVLSYFLGHIHKILFSYMVQPFYISGIIAIMSVVQSSNKKELNPTFKYSIYLYPPVIALFMLFYNLDFVSYNVNIIFVLVIISFLLIILINYFSSSYHNLLLLVIPILLVSTPNFNSQYRKSNCGINETMSRDFYNIVKLSINLKGPGLILFNGDSAYSVSKNCASRIRYMADSLNYIGAYTYGLRDLDSVNQNELENELNQISHNSVIILGDLDSLNLSPKVRNILDSKFNSFRIYNQNLFMAQIIVGKG
jgi:hypothetical protein